MEQINIYERVITVRESTNRFGKMGYTRHFQIVATADVDAWNKGKKIRFTESRRAEYDPEFLAQLISTPDKLYDERIE